MSIIPLKTCRRVLTWVFVCPVSKPLSNWKKLAYIALSLLIPTLIMMNISASVTFFLKFVSIDLAKSVCALSPFTANTGLFYVTIVVFIGRHKIHAMFESLSKIYESRETFLSIFRFLLYEKLISIKIKT